MYLGIRPEGWLTILAILLGPLLAFEVQRRRDNSREKHNRRLQIFQRLLMTLKVPLNPNHVDALNSIHVEFYDDQNVIDAWRLYVSHLNSRQRPNDGARWSEKKFDLLVKLVYLMGQSLGYKLIDEAAIRDNTYVPQGYSDIESELETIRKRCLEVLGGQRPIAMSVLGPILIEPSLQVPEQIPTPELSQSAHAGASESTPTSVVVDKPLPDRE